MKTCSGCKQQKSVEEFSKQQCAQDGLQRNCKACFVRMRNIRLEKVGKAPRSNIAKSCVLCDRKHFAKSFCKRHYNASVRAHEMAVDPIGTRIKYRKWSINNSKIVAERTKEWREKNQQWVVEYRKKNAAKYLAQGIAYRTANPEKVAVFKANRRARLLKSEGTHTAEEISKLLMLQKGKCACCKIDIRDRFHRDHVVALANGGSNSIDNIQLLCVSCNCSKGARDPVTFMQSRGYLI